MELDAAGASAREVTQLWAHVAGILAGLRDRSVFGRFQRLFAEG
jgi:hypothetical protein